MRKGLIQWLLVVIASSLFMVQPALAAEGSDGRLVSVQWLEKNLKRDDVLVIDASPAKLHSAGHIPGAVNVDIFSFGGREIPAAEMERRIQSWGVSRGKKIVIYDQGGTYLATSLFFDLYYHGFPAEGLTVLDGGLAKWQAAGGAVTKDPTPAPKPGTFRVAKLKEDVRVRLPEFLVASGDPANNALVEALEPGQHFGGAKFFDRAGHIPNAIMMPSADFYNADKTFKSPEEIRRMLAYLGIKPEQQVLHALRRRHRRQRAVLRREVHAGLPQGQALQGIPARMAARRPGAAVLDLRRAEPDARKDLAERMGQPDDAQLRRGEAQRRRRAPGSVVQAGPCAVCHQRSRGRLQAPSRDAREAGRSSRCGRCRRGTRSGRRFGGRIEPRFGPGLPHAGKTGTEEGLRLLGFRGRLGIRRLPAEQGDRRAGPQEGTAGISSSPPRRTPSISARAS